LERGEVAPRVDCEYHALLTVVCLTAVNPDRVCVLNSELSRGEWTIGVGICNRDESRIKPAWGCLTRVLERRLRSRMVFLLEGKRNGIARSRSNLVRVKLEDPNASNGNLVIRPPDDRNNSQ